LESALVGNGRQSVVGRHDEASHRLLAESPSTRAPENGRVESSTARGGVKWSSRATLTRTAAVDVDDSGSQTSSSCPTSSSSTSPTPPAVQQLYVHPWPATGAVAGLGEPARPAAVAVCRVRPLTDVDWRGGGGHPAVTATVRRDGPGEGDGAPAGREVAVPMMPPPTARRYIVPPSTDPAVPCPYHDHCATLADAGSLKVKQQHEAIIVESRITVYDNVGLQQLQV